MEHFNSILFHKSGPANKQHANQSSMKNLREMEIKREMQHKEEKRERERERKRMKVWRKGRLSELIIED